MAANLVPNRSQPATMHPYLLNPLMVNHFAFGPLPRHLLCGYRSKACMAPRARKRDGSLHRFCEDHRQRASTNQKKWASRRMHATVKAEAVHDLHLYHDLLASTATMATEFAQANRQWFPLLAPPVLHATEPEEAAHCESISATDEHEMLSMVAQMSDGDLLWEALGLAELLDGRNSH